MAHVMLGGGGGGGECAKGLPLTFSWEGKSQQQANRQG